MTISVKIEPLPAPDKCTSKKPPEKKRRLAKRREERIIAGLEEIQRFVDKHGRPPQRGEDRDIYERLYAERLDRIRALEDCRTLLAPFDRQGLLTGDMIAPPVAEMDEEAILADGISPAPATIP